jgi:hypothetical protein
VPAYLRRLNEESSLQGQHFDTLTISTPGAGPESAGAAAPLKTAASGPPAAPAIKYLDFSVSTAPLSQSAKTGARQ